MQMTKVRVRCTRCATVNMAVEEEPKSTDGPEGGRGT
jgi:hypothetical protein